MLVGTLRRLLYALRGNQRYARYEALKKMQYLPRAQAEKAQMAALSKLIHHAYTSTPYYKELFDAEGLRPEDIRTFEDYAHIPVLTKQTMLEQGECLCSSVMPKQGRILNSSGGTTGNPASFYQDYTVYKEMDAHYLLILSMAGWTPDAMIVSLWGNAKDFLQGSKPSVIKPWLAGTLTCNTFKYTEQDMRTWYKAICRYKKVFLYGYATALMDFAKYCLEQNLPLNNIGGAVSTAEQLFPEQRAVMEKAFHCQIFNQYGAREVPGVASECAYGHMHIFTTSAYTEFLPLANTEDAAPKQRIILTSLNNYTMPLLRYEIGDFGRPYTLEGPDETCPCGCSSRLMHMDMGRMGATLLLPSGGKLYSSLFVRQICAISGIQNFQFRQKELHRIDLYIIRGADFSSASEHALQEVVEKFPVSVCPGATLHLHYVEHLPRTQGGKHRHVICDIAG